MGRARGGPGSAALGLGLFITRLRTHEHGHQRIAIDTGRELLERVEALRAPDCDALRVHARSLADAFQARVELEQRSWDLAIDHGRSGEG